MDAYLAAFAISGSFRMVTFDAAFTEFEAEGLDLVLLRAASPT
jgi:predicted nucleic acid-binding protein